MENFQEVKKSLIEQLKDSDAFKCDVKQVMLEDVIDVQTWNELLDVICDSIFSYLDNGILLPDGRYKNDEKEFTVLNGKMDGQYLAYDENGNCFCKCNYLKGKLHGKYLFFYEDDTLQIDCNYVNGQLHGEYLEYDKDGNLKEKRNYVHGQKIETV
jgi:hypothetical protein